MNSENGWKQGGREANGLRRPVMSPLYCFFEGRDKCLKEFDSPKSPDSPHCCFYDRCSYLSILEKSRSPWILQQIKAPSNPTISPIMRTPYLPLALFTTFAITAPVDDSASSLPFQLGEREAFPLDGVLLGRDAVNPRYVFFNDCKGNENRKEFDRTKVVTACYFPDRDFYLLSYCVTPCANKVDIATINPARLPA